MSLLRSTISDSRSRRHKRETSKSIVNNNLSSNTISSPAMNKPALSFEASNRSDNHAIKSLGQAINMHRDAAKPKQDSIEKVKIVNQNKNNRLSEDSKFTKPVDSSGISKTVKTTRNDVFERAITKNDNFNDDVNKQPLNIKKVHAEVLEQAKDIITTSSTAGVFDGSSKYLPTEQSTNIESRPVLSNKISLDNVSLHNINNKSESFDNSFQIQINKSEPYIRHKQDELIEKPELKSYLPKSDKKQQFTDLKRANKNIETPLENINSTQSVERKSVSPPDLVSQHAASIKQESLLESKAIYPDGNVNKYEPAPQEQIQPATNKENDVDNSRFNQQIEENIILTKALLENASEIKEQSGNIVSQANQIDYARTAYESAAPVYNNPVAKDSDVNIGAIDIYIETPRRTDNKNVTTVTRPSSSLSSRHYLRRL